MLTQAIRRQFLQYFKERSHTIVPSSPVIPHDDPSLLFINAGMNQFKDVFLGKTVRDYVRATSSQKCVRVGGKHNDLENVGHTSRHLTFFEMLGNFSFGDYFKAEAIRFSWEVSTEIFQFDPDRIWPTVFREDDEAFELWRQYVPAERITRFDEKDNFWMMGETGPCGPCSELLYDRGSSYGSASKPSEDPSGERFLEYWNLVFMQYNRLSPNDIQPLPKPSIDTGAGLERVVNLKMGVNSVFETDVLRSIIAEIESVSKVSYNKDDARSSAFRVISDHLRCLSFAIADGVQPSNVDRGYVLRKVLRRAVRYGRMLGLDRPFLADILPQLVAVMGDDYPELVKGQGRIAEILTIEEEAFIRTLKKGGNILNQIVDKAAKASNHTIGGDDAFKLKDTYGLPLEEILLIAKDSGLKVDEERYQTLELEAKERSRQVQKNVSQVASENIYEEFIKNHKETNFVGYIEPSCQTQVLGLVKDGQFAKELIAGEEGLVILSKTPFYAEMGGQVGDTGTLKAQGVLFNVKDCQSPYKGVISHFGKLEEGVLKTGDLVEATIDLVRRQQIANNHTATHLLHWALHQVLGEHIKQAGSVVDASRLRFDFSHHKALTAAEILQIEDLVNAKIRGNRSVDVYELPYEDAQTREDIKQFFGEKYGHTVRVIDVDYSKELCGGTHTSAVGTIGYFRITKESSIAAGIRRIEAVTGLDAEQFARSFEDSLTGLSQTLKTPPHLIQERIEKLLEENKVLTLEIKNRRAKELETLADSILNQKELKTDFSFVVAEVALSSDELKLCLDRALEKLVTGVVVLGTVLPDRCLLMAKVSDDLVKKGYSASELIKAAMPFVEGSGGGKPQMAQGGGKVSKGLVEALDAVVITLRSK